MLQSIPLLSHQLLSFTIFCTILVSSIISVSLSPSSPSLPAFFTRSPFISSPVHSESSFLLTNISPILPSRPSLHSFGTFCMSAPALVTSSKQSHHAVCVASSQCWMLNKPWAQEVKVSILKVLLAWSIVRQAQPPSCCFRSLVDPPFLPPPHLSVSFAPSADSQCNPAAVEFIVPTTQRRKSALWCDGPKNPHTGSHTKLQLSLLFGVSYILHVAHPSCVSLCQLLSPTPPIPVTLANVLGKERETGGLRSGLTVMGSVVSSLGELKLLINGVCLCTVCVNGGERHICGLHACIWCQCRSGERPVFWARGHADCSVLFKSYSVCIFHSRGQQILQRRKHKNTRLSDSSAYIFPQPWACCFHLYKH